MSEIMLPDFGRLVTKARVYDLQESVCAARYSHAAPEHCSAEITENIIKLAQAPAGSGHDCFLKGILVSFDLRLTLKAWNEAERYHFFDLVTSESTMHSIIYATADQICENDFVDPMAAVLLIDKIEKYNESPSEENFLGMIYNIPSGLLLTARISANYMQLKTIYAQRRTHRLPEWRRFCEWIETLPHSEMITHAHTQKRGGGSRMERIRAMSLEELARIIVERSACLPEDSSFCRSLPRCEDLLTNDEDIPDKDCIECAKLWLMQQVPKEDA